LLTSLHSTIKNITLTTQSHKLDLHQPREFIEQRFNELILSLIMSITSTTVYSFTVFGKGERMWIKRVLQNKSANRDWSTILNCT